MNLTDLQTELDRRQFQWTFHISGPTPEDFEHAPHLASRDLCTIEWVKGITFRPISFETEEPSPYVFCLRVDADAAGEIHRWHVWHDGAPGPEQLLAEIGSVDEAIVRATLTLTTAKLKRLATGFAGRFQLAPTPEALLTEMQQLLCRLQMSQNSLETTIAELRVSTGLFSAVAA